MACCPYGMAPACFSRVDYFGIFITTSFLKIIHEYTFFMA
jgi:hypothetical protein